ncbi:hypothetical protein GCM10010247_34350 [Streptomyces calvus]|nr:hypothetical protein GCM10010247_34350 [Streptomyces calvus]
MPSAPETAEASAEATAASAVPAGAVTSTSQLAARSRVGEEGPRGSTTVSRICIAVSGPFCAGARDTGTKPHRGPPTADFPHRHTRTYGQYWEASSHLSPTTRPPSRIK